MGVDRQRRADMRDGKTSPPFVKTVLHSACPTVAEAAGHAHTPTDHSSSCISSTYYVAGMP
eukprot:4047618-Pleurochrysis_carterae.AAC.1